MSEDNTPRHEPAASSPGLPEFKGTLDLETLKLAYAEAQSDLTTLRQRKESALRAVAAFPASAAVVIGLALTVKPDTEDVIVSVLYALGLVPFVMIVRRSLELTEILLTLKTTWERVVAESGEKENVYIRDEDQLTPETWLVNRIVDARFYLQAEASSTEEGDVVPEEERILLSLQRLLAIEVLYLVAVSIVAPFLV
jgi:hypothetical protein